jgi:hypothetical protein
LFYIVNEQGSRQDARKIRSPKKARGEMFFAVSPAFWFGKKVSQGRDVYSTADMEGGGSFGKK